MEEYIKNKINFKLSVRYSYNGCFYGVYHERLYLSLFNCHLKQTLKKTSVKFKKDKYVICINTENPTISILDLLLKDYNYNLPKESKQLIIDTANDEKDIYSYFTIIMNGFNTIKKGRIYNLNKSILKIEIPIHNLTKIFNPTEIIAIKLLENKELNQEEIVIAEAINLKI